MENAPKDADLDLFIKSANAAFIVALYERYLADPGSVDPSWTALFARLAAADRATGPGAARGMSPRGRTPVAASDGTDSATAEGGGVPSIDRRIVEALRAIMLVG